MLLAAFVTDKKFFWVVYLEPARTWCIRILYLVVLCVQCAFAYYVKTRFGATKYKHVLIRNSIDASAVTVVLQQY